MAEVKLEEQHSSHCGSHEVKEEEELSLKQEPEEFPLHIITVKTEDDEDESSVLETKVWDCDDDESSVQETKVWDCDEDESSVQETKVWDCDEDESSVQETKVWDCDEDSEDQTDKAEGLAPETNSTAQPQPGPFSCSECGRRFSFKSYLKRHMVVHTGEKPFGCPVCGQCFTQKSSLTFHMRGHLNAPRSDLPPSLKLFSCSVCGERFMSSNGLRRHGSLHSRERPHKCSLCDERFVKEHDLVFHQTRVHHICALCKAPFSNQDALNEHLRIHVKERASVKPFGCSACGKRFKLKCDVKRHMAVHTGETPFSHLSSP